MKDKKLDMYLMGQLVGQLMACGIIGATLLIVSKCSSGKAVRDKDVVRSSVVNKAPCMTDSIMTPRFTRHR